jgi:hypothetical protein
MGNPFPGSRIAAAMDSSEALWISIGLSGLDSGL